MLAHDAGEVPGQGCVRARTAAIDAGSARSVAFDEAASARAGAAPRNRATAHCADSFGFFTPRADDFADAVTTQVLRVLRNTAPPPPPPWRSGTSWGILGRS